MHLDNISFRAITSSDAGPIVDIINYYITNSTFYFSDKPLGKSSIEDMLAGKGNLPGYVVLYDEELVGFGYAYPFRPESTFAATVKLTYWLKEGFTGKGIGKQLYGRLEQKLRKQNIASILVNISSDNTASVHFHHSLGYNECGSFEKIGFKNGKYFDLVWMQKFLEYSCRFLDC
ncbi:MAG TPA: GNAT family N-acetyltransferase [Dyadobacter sp.]|jgi:phosphinothricin acetyltransferase|nr:GNAT family N-acetyltransferase [Dyadobacter sp.]